jgi:hypothetical protein
MTVCTHIDYGDIHKKIFSEFFDNLKYVFQVKGAYASTSQIEFWSFCMYATNLSTWADVIYA